jgi:hypothetical protein
MGLARFVVLEEPLAAARGQHIFCRRVMWRDREHHLVRQSKADPRTTSAYLTSVFCTTFGIAGPDLATASAFVSLSADWYQTPAGHLISLTK